MGNVVTLIPKQMRMDWVDVMAIDPDLSHTAFRIGCVIAKHFNKTSGLTFIGYPGIARVLKISPRTAFGGVEELEKRGYLLVTHRKGRSRANEYRPAIDNSQCTASLAAEKLATRCELLRSENLQSSALKLATDCNPTLTAPTEQDSTCPIASLDSSGWRGVMARLRERLGTDVTRSWFGRASLDKIEGEAVTIRVPTKFLRSHIETHFADVLIASWQAERPQIRTVRVVVNTSPAAAAERPQAFEKGNDDHPASRVRDRNGGAT